MIRIVSIKFRTAGKLYDFHAGDLELETGDAVVVETDRGRTLGTVVIAPREVPKKQLPNSLKGVQRKATEKDLDAADKFLEREEAAYRYCMQRIQERKMEMKLVRAEYVFDGSKIVFYFTADGRIDFRDLVKDLAQHFHTRIEMRQIGVRDEAKITGGIGICGRELCCCTFLRDFQPVSVKMAKEQGLALNPSKISGQCGRLLCCLGYEFETYCSLKKALPKSGKKIRYAGKEAEVIKQNVLNQTVRVRTADNSIVELTLEEIREHAEAPPIREAEKEEKKSRPSAPPRREQKKQGRPAEESDEKTKAPAPTGKPEVKQEEKPEKKKRRRRRRKPRRKGGEQSAPPDRSPSK
ncbi:MAG: stage 0 sporulation family protein [Desulfuromonadales bacterium]